MSARLLWGPELLALNPGAKPTVEHVGEGRHRVVIVDDFYRHPDQIAGLARGLHYVRDPDLTGELPGARATVSLDTAGLLAAMSREWGAPLEPFFGPQPMVFSAIEDTGQQLDAAQRQPHVDPGVTALIYLNPDDECAGGTGLYRHRPTGLERIPARPTEALLQLAAERGYDVGSFRKPGGFMNFLKDVVFNPRFAVPENTYINDGNEFWELLYLIEMRCNRLVIFHGHMPHSQYLYPRSFRGRTRLNQIFYLRAK